MCQLTEAEVSECPKIGGILVVTKYMAFRGRDIKLGTRVTDGFGARTHYTTRKDMAFVNWFRRKSERTEAEAQPVLAEKFAPVPTSNPEPVPVQSEQETEPAATDQVANEPAANEPVANEPVANEPVANEPVANEPVANESAANEPAANEPAANEPAANEPAANEPVANELPVTPESVPGDSELATCEYYAPPAARHLSVAIGAFYAKLPAHLLAPRTPDLKRFVQIAEEDMVIDEETEEATLPLSILSLSCPEIFNQAVDGADDVPVTFSIAHPKDLEPTASDPSSHLEETEAILPPTEDEVVAGVDQVGETEIKVRLDPILTNFPPDLEPPAIHTLIGTQAEIVLPLGLILSQLKHGRVVVPAEIFCKALPIGLKPYFESIDPAAEIPIPLEEIFSRLPPSATKIREDQEVDLAEETIPTPFTEHADEDAKRFAQAPVEETISANEAASEPKDGPPRIAVESDSKRLQAIFLTDEPLDLAKTIQNVAALPGLKSCLLSTTEGHKLAGRFGDPGQEEAILTVLPELFDWTESKLQALHAGPLETITFYYGHHQLSAFVQGKLCLTVFHDNRPFKPGVREKIQAVIKELAALSAAEKPV